MDIEERVARLEAIESIRRLKARYCDICDAGHDPKRIVDLFADDGVWEYVGQGAYRGHAQIRANFERLAATVVFSQHNAINLDLVVERNTATGTWHFLGLIAVHDDVPRLTAARYEETYVCRDGEWKILHLRAVRLAQAEIASLVY